MIEKKLDIIAAILGISLGILIVIASVHYHFNREHTGFALLIPSIFYLVFRKKLIDTSQKLDFDMSNNKSGFLSLTIAFMVFFMLSIFLLSAELYHRPSSYFIVVTIISAIIAAQILLFKEEKHIWLWFILFEIFLLSINIRSSVYFEFPGLYGADTWWHCEFAQRIAQFGYIPSGEAYSWLPIMHLEIAITKILSGLNDKSSFFIISIIETFSTIFVFLVGRHLFNTKIGLLSMLILNISNYHILWGINIIPMTIGASLFAIIAFLILNKSSKHELNRIIWSIFSIFFLFVIVITHTVITFITFVALLSIFAAIKIYPFLKTVKTNIIRYNEINVTLTIILFFGIFFIQYWMFAFPQSGVPFFNGVVLSAKDAITSADISEVSKVTYAGEIDPKVIFLNELGYDILLALMVIGICTSFKNNSLSKFAVIISGFVMFALVYLTALGGTNAILPYRWFICIYTLLCTIASLGVFALARLGKSKTKKFTSFFFIIAILTFFMITGGYANSDSPVYSIGSGRSGYYMSEQKGAGFLSEIYNGTITTDYCYAGYCRERFFIPSSYINPEDPRTYSSGLIVLRRFIIEELKGFPVPHGGIAHGVEFNESFTENFETKNYYLVYESGQVKAYYRRQ